MLPPLCRESSALHHPTRSKEDPKDTPESGQVLELLLPAGHGVCGHEEAGPACEELQADETAFWVVRTQWL